MKKLINVSLVLLLLFSVADTFAQGKYKFGHIDANQLLLFMPERVNAQNAIQEHARQLEEQLLAMQAELNNKYQEYLTKQDSLSDLIKQTKEKELQDLQLRIQTFQADAQQSVINKETELIQPIIEKARNAIQEVAKENGFTYIFDVSTGAVLYFSDDSKDILPLVKKKLGLE